MNTGKFILISSCIIAGVMFSFSKRGRQVQSAIPVAKNESFIKVENSQPHSIQNLVQPSAPSPVASPVITSTQSLPAQKKMALMVSDALQKMPTVHNLRKLNEEEVHFTPQIILEAGKRLAAIAQLAHDEPDSIPVVTLFYENCASGKNFPVPIRAVCYSNLKSTNLRRFHAIVPSISSEVRELASQLD